MARTCYDHMAGKLGVLLHSRLKAMGWLLLNSHNDNACKLSVDGENGFGSLGIDVEETRAARRRFAYECLDWSERQPHLAGALGAALLGIARKRKWVMEDLDSRALSITSQGKYTTTNDPNVLMDVYLPANAAATEKLSAVIFIQ